MSKTTIIWIAIIIVLLALGIWWWVSAANTGSTVTPTTPSTSYNSNQNPNTANSPITPTYNSGISATDTSNAALDQDLSLTDSQMSGLNGDSANVNQSLSDQPVPQGQ